MHPPPLPASPFGRAMGIPEKGTPKYTQYLEAQASRKRKERNGFRRTKLLNEAVVKSALKAVAKAVRLEADTAVPREPNTQPNTRAAHDAFQLNSAFNAGFIHHERAQAHSCLWTFPCGATC